MALSVSPIIWNTFLLRFYEYSKLDNSFKTDNPAHLEYQKSNREKGRMSGQVRIRVRFKKYATKWFDYLMLSKKEMKDIIEVTSWHVKQFIDSEGVNYAVIIEK
jgi:hypothetical protein